MRNSRNTAALLVALAALSLSLACGKKTDPAPQRSPGTAIDMRAITGSAQIERFAEIKLASQLPPAVLDQLGGIADPDGRFNATDVVMKDLPSKQLTAAAASDRYCILSYWQGGFALRFQTDIYELSGGKATLIWQSYSQGGFSFRELKEMVESGKLINVLPNSPLPPGKKAGATGQQH